MEFRRATSVDDALAELADLGSAACVVAGGTDAMMQLARGQLHPTVLLHIEPVRSLASLSYTPLITMGALVTHWALATDRRVTQSHPALAEAAATVGGWQTQAVGTVGGNVCNASPAADTIPPLLVSDATVNLRSVRGSRQVPLEKFLLGRRSVDREPDELVTSIDAEPIGPRTGEAYLKVGRRGAMVVALVGLAVRLTFDGSGCVSDARVAVCSMAPTPMRVPEAEEALGAWDGSEDPLRHAARALAASLSPIDDGRATATYRSGVLEGLLAQAANLCRSRANIERSMIGAH